MDDRLPLTTRLVSLSAALAPFVCGIAAQCAGHAPRPVAASIGRAGLVFSQRLVDLGEVTPREEVFARFEFRNAGQTAVVVDKLEASCGCLQPVIDRKEYRPGDRGRFVARVQTANQVAGFKEYRIKMKYHDPHPRESELLFRVTLPYNQVFVRPRTLAVTSVESNDSTVWPIEIIDRRPQPLSIKSASCTHPSLAQLEIADATTDDEGATHFHITATIRGGLPPGRQDAVIQISTEDPEYRFLTIPLRVVTVREQPKYDPEVQTVGAEDEGETKAPGRAVRTLHNEVHDKNP